MQLEKTGSERLINVLIADDHTLFREGVLAILSSIPGMQVAGEAADGLEAVSKAVTLKPDVILMDIQMPELNGIEATRRIQQSGLDARVIILTMYEDDDSVFAAMRAGARGYILKGADQDELLRAIRGVSSGEAIFGPAIATRMMNYFSGLKLDSEREAYPELTDREREVLDLIARGENNASIAKTLTISQKTVRNHVSNIFNKLQVADRAQAIVQARKKGFGG
ncbi:MAG: response regulator [Anaerolineales bacterium]|jgi:DNA-binding NarL/FixJ family response regulator